MRFFSSAAPGSSRDCPQTDASEERERRLHSAITMLRTLSQPIFTLPLCLCLRMAASGGAIIPGALHYCKMLKQQCGKLPKKNSCLCLRLYLPGERAIGGRKPPGIKLRKYCFQVKSKGTSHRKGNQYLKWIMERQNTLATERKAPNKSPANDK